MIQANELRIGNYVTYNPKVVAEGVELVPLKIRTIGFSDVTLHDGFSSKYFFHEILPIPLTPELLIKCGFTQSESKFTFDLDKLSIHLPSDSYKNGRTYYNSWCIIEHGVKYLHQLQNLFYCLTNEELKIEL